MSVDIKQEPDDGSIFVCFLCEKEFKQVSELNQHMEDHDQVPEMSDDFPKRKRNKAATNKKQPDMDQLSDDAANFIDVSSVDTLPVTKLFTDTRTYSDKKSASRLKLPSAPDTFKLQRRTYGLDPKSVPIKAPLKTERKENPEKKKIDPASIALKRALNLKRIIMARESKREQEEKTDDSSFADNSESIMMVDSETFYSRKEKNTVTGPTVLNGEPLGFVCPPSQNSSTKSHSLKPREKWQEVIDRNCADSGEDSSDFEARYVTSDAPKRGRGRPKKVKVESWDDDETSDSRFTTLQDKVSRQAQTPAKSRRPVRVTKVEPENEEEAYQCLECSKIFRTMSTMKVHMKSHATNREIACPYCDEVFPQRYILYEHLVNDHEESNNLTCPICHKIYTRPDSLKTHMVRMHEKDGGLNCYVCAKSFPSQAQLEMHVRVHTGERPYKCDVCGKGFVQKVHLQTHLRTMHNTTVSQNTTPCRVCDMMLPGRSSLKDHHIEAHNMSPEEYRAYVGRMRKEGKIPEVIPPKVKVVDPSFRYTKVDVSDAESGTFGKRKAVGVYEEMSAQMMNGVNKPSNLQARNFHVTGSATKSSPNKIKVKTLTTTVFGRNGARKLKMKAYVGNEERLPGMGTVMDMGDCLDPFNDDNPFNDVSRDEEEMHIVENAFKVAEEMDQMGQLSNGSSTIITSSEITSAGTTFYTTTTDVSQASVGQTFITNPTYVQNSSLKAVVVSEEDMQMLEGTDFESLVMASQNEELSNVEDQGKEDGHKDVESRMMELFSTGTAEDDENTVDMSAM